MVHQIMFKYVEIFCSLKMSGVLLHMVGSMQDNPIWPGLVLWKGHSHLKKLPLVWIWFSRAVWKTSLRYLGHWLLTYLQTIELMHRWNLLVGGNQFRVSNSLWDICVILSNCRQKRMDLFWEVWILFFNFLVKLGYQGEQVQSKCGYFSRQHTP